MGLSGNLSIESVTVASVALLPLDTEKGGDDREKRKTREDKLEDEVEEEEEETLLQSSSRGVVRSGGKAKVGAFYTLKTRWAATEGTGAEEGEQGANGRAGPKEKEHRFRFRDFDKLDVKVCGTDVEIDTKGSSRCPAWSCYRRPSHPFLTFLVLGSTCRSLLCLPPQNPQMRPSFLSLFRFGLTFGDTTLLPPSLVFLPNI